ncbi:hypothetical protein TNCT_149121 [Trichonephila clavata]|uniref:Uncharacterized protein n=1 Tax=Trichonephila clavata TaxID=2740835 RepID=A0A8X6L7B4_TRICU|nr:hypothetical protein TNCT_149121 [Trichonephila clavata]
MSKGYISDAISHKMSGEGSRLKKKYPKESTFLEKQLDTWITNLHKCGKIVAQSSTDSADTMKGIPPMRDDSSQN